MGKLLIASLVALVLLCSVMLVPTLSAYAATGSDTTDVTATGHKKGYGFESFLNAIKPVNTKALAQLKAIADAKAKAIDDAKAKANTKPAGVQYIISAGAKIGDAHKGGKHDPGGGPNPCVKEKYNKNCPL